MIKFSEFKEFMEGVEKGTDPHAGQPTGIKISMKHPDHEKHHTVTFLGTFSAVKDARTHISDMKKKGYTLAHKELTY